MSGQTDYEATKRLAKALNERNHAEYDQAIESLEWVIGVCKESRSATAQYLLRTATVTLYGIYQSIGRNEEAVKCKTEALKLGVTKADLEKA